MGVTLKRDGWHFRLQNFVLDDEAERRINLCPYFWITVFCLMVVPFVGIFKGIFYLFIYLMGSLSDFFDKKICPPLEKFFVSHFSNSILETMWRYSLERQKEEGTHARSYCGPNTLKLGDKFAIWKKSMEEKGIDWKKELENILKKQEEERNEKIEKENKLYKARKIKEQNQRERKAKIDKVMITIAKYLFPPILFSIAVISITFIAWIFWRIYVLANWVKFFAATLMVLKVLLIGVVVIVPIVLAIYLIKKCEFNMSLEWDDPILKPILKPFVFVWNPISKSIKKVFSIFNVFGYIFGGIKSFFSFFWEYAKGWKEDHCPMISWED